MRTILGISWGDHITNDELRRRAGREDLSNIVRVRRLTLAGRIPQLPSDRPASVTMQGRPGDKHARKIYRRCESAGMVIAEWQ